LRLMELFLSGIGWIHLGRMSFRNRTVVYWEASSVAFWPQTAVRPNTIGHDGIRINMKHN
jgi:hypothetical protein